MPGLESELEIERSKTVARWFGIVIITAILQWQRSKGVYPELTAGAFAFVVGGVCLINAAHSVYLFRTSACPDWYKYLSVGLDLIFLTATLRYTGIAQSPFFYLYFLLLISNCIRYGLLMSLYIAIGVNVLYAVALSLSPVMAPSVLGGEGLKILAFWGVAMYGGTVSARIRRQAFEIASYEETIAELRARLSAESAPEGRQGIEQDAE